MSENYNKSISFVRVIAMLSIILGHLCTTYKINTYQFGGIGVEIFFFISGYLYSNKHINNYVKWWKQRWKRIILPLWCAVCICLIISLSLGMFNGWSSLLSYAFCIQGLKHIFFNILVPTMPGMAQSWFLTVLVVCYALMIFIKKNKMIENWVNEHIVFSLLIAFVLQIVLCYVGIQLVYIIQFFIGYFIAKRYDGKTNNQWVTKRNIRVLTIRKRQITRL